MDYKAEYENRADTKAAPISVFLFGWCDDLGNTGDYGLIDETIHKTFKTLINTTYMFQPEPKFTLQCRTFKMSQDQLAYLQEHDLDTEEFLSSLGEMPDVKYAINLNQHNTPASALLELEKICG